jgi:hypothetical protein
MTGTTERHMCRNSRCRSRLPAPVSNPREAFCARGCHSQFYRKRCIACEQPMERKRESQQLCGRRKCKSQFAALKVGFLLGRYHPSSHALDASRNSTKPGTFSPLKSDRGWRQVAGPAVDVHLAAIGADDAVKRRDRVNRARWRVAGAAALIQKHHAPVNVIGGFKFANAPVIDLGTVPTASSDPDAAAGVHRGRRSAARTEGYRSISAAMTTVRASSSTATQRRFDTPQRVRRGDVT